MVREVAADRKPPRSEFWPLGCREGDSPEIQRLILFDKFDSVRAASFHCTGVRNHAGGNLRSPLILHDNDRPDWQIPIQLNGGSVFVQVGRFGGHREVGFVTILARQAHRCMQGDPVAAALGD